MRKFRMLFLVGSLLAVASVASAGNTANTFSISPMIGGISFGGDQHLQTSPLFGARAGYNFTKALGVEALFDYAKSESTLNDRTLEFYRYGGEILYHFMPDRKFVPYVAAGYAAMNFRGKSTFTGTNETKGVLDYGLGAKYFVTDDIAWRGDVRHLIYKYGDTRHAVEYTMGLYIPFGAAKTVSKLADPPPVPAHVAEPPPVPVVKPLAPPPPVPTVVLSANPASITKGESAMLVWKSSNAANCDLQPAPGLVAPQGSIAVTPEASTEYLLNCIGDGGTAKSATMVTVTAPVVKASPVLERFCNKPAVLKINFDTDKYNIKPEYHNELKTVGDFIKDCPKAAGEISGHTDSIASNKYNQKLSERRAESVRNYIVRKFGIAPERISAKGYGEDKPVASNKTEEGRALNRRIEANFACD